jgi:adenosylcobinamide kinase/adenosylcobinamide-phosphate guanylyltransferase
MTKITLVTGGARSGKSHYAEALLADKPHVTYIATAPTYPHDSEWTSRIELHQSRRPAHWTTIETSLLTEALTEVSVEESVLVDCLTLWLTATIDRLGGWTLPHNSPEYFAFLSELDSHIQELCETAQACQGDIVFVTNEVGSGIIPAVSSGRLFQDLLGKLNVAMGGISDSVVLVVAGRALEIYSATPESRI